ncbi:MAG: protein-export chaperone SecB [Desulfobacterales bacterium]|nr:protein-export chaperone SecB [Desulfobacterales bacterium]MDD4073128.1 protein-export chaperone SecB [Desulfobacterales bacterium]MDD4429259.1 protein-export chaperone SecB [Paludibacter sp.]
MLTAPPLELKKYFFPYVKIVADVEYEPSEKEITPNFEVKTSVEHSETNHIYQVGLEIIAEPEDEKSKIPYSIRLVVVGLFTVNEKFPDPNKLLKINGASMLYSAAREFVITVTSRGPWPHVVIPTVSFLPQDKKQVETEDTGEMDIKS